MSHLPAKARAVVYDPNDGSIELRELPVRPPKPGEVVARVSLSAICGSDLHTISGRRRPRGALILGHEICGQVAALGEGVERDAAGEPLRIGDRVTWGIAANCGTCFCCTHDLPQKCERLFKYGHESIDVDPPLNGGYAEMITLAPGSTIYRLPDDLPDEQAVFANCSLATMAAAVRLARVAAGEAVLIHGAGMVGVCAAALCSALGARAVAVTDVDHARLERARAFGATHVVNPATTDAGGPSEALRDAAGERGFDVAIEVCGQPNVIPPTIDMLRIGGRFVIAGCVFPNATVELDMYPVITRLVSLIGLHNYAPEDLGAALRFLAAPGRRFPFDRVVARRYPLAEFDRALAEVQADKGILRVGVGDGSLGPATGGSRPGL